MIRIIAATVFGLVAVGFIVNTLIENSMWEGSSPWSVSFSPSESRAGGRFVARSFARPDSFIVQGERIVIDSAWIEREIHDSYSFLFFRSRQYFDRYRLVFMFRNLSGEDPNFAFSAQNAPPIWLHSQGERGPFVYSLDLRSDYSDTIRLNFPDSDSKLTAVDFMPVVR